MAYTGKQREKFGVLSRPESWRVSTVKLLAALILLFAVTPFVEDFPNGDLVESGLVTVVMIAALIAVAQRSWVLIVAALLVVPTLAGKWLHHFFPNYVSGHYFLVFGIAFLAFTICRILLFILRTKYVDTEVLSAGIVVYLMLGLLWSQTYMLLGQFASESFVFTVSGNSGPTMDDFSAFYFSFSTLTTLGFGDIMPVSRIARTLAIMESITGTLYLAILISRLVAMYSPRTHSDSSNHPDSL